MKLFLLLLPTLTLATVDVQLSGNIDFNRGKISGVFDAPNYTKEGKTLTDKDRNSFNILDTEVLKDVIERENGKRPDKVHLISPENHNNFYKENKFEEVKTRIVPIEIIGIQAKSKEVLLNKKPYDIYNDDGPKKAVIEVSVLEKHTLSSEWTNAKNTVDDKVHLDLKFRINCGKIEIDHTFDWGKNKRTRFGKMLQETEEIVLTPGKETIAELRAKKGIVEFDIHYNISLTGDVVAVYDDMYKGKRYHSFNIANIMDAKELSPSKTATQKLSYCFFYGTFLRIVEIEPSLRFSPKQSEKPKLSGKPELSPKPIVDDFKDIDEIAGSEVKGMGKIKMASESELKKYILKDIDEDKTYTGSKESETNDNQSEVSEESAEN